MRLRPFGALARAGLFLSCLAAASSAQLATEIAVEHRAGQTFVTWREAKLLGVHYRVYRSETPILGTADLALADRLGEVDDKSSHDAERSRVERGERTWIIAPGGAPLAVDQGLFVHTAQTDSAGAFYAVTSVWHGVENALVVPGRNATELALSETCAPPEPVLQAQTSVRETWAHWVGDRDTPFQAAMSLTPSHGFVFGFEPGSSAGRRGLMLRLHSAGGTYAQGWPPRALVPSDVDVLALSDLHPTTGYTFWFGAHERFPDAPAADTKVWSFTQQRVLWTLDWMCAHRADALDPTRVCLVGSSLGAIGGMYLLEEAPARFSAALLRNGNYDLESGDYDETDVFEKLYGPFALDLPLRSGLPVLDRTDARFMANLDPTADWPPIRTINGRQDHRVGWASAVSLFAGLAETWRPAVHYFDDRTHSPKGYWSKLERALIKRTCQVASDRPALCFSACTLDDDAGDGTRTSGDTIGTLGGYVEYDPLTAASTEGDVRFDVYLRSQKALDDALASLGWAELTPRRTGAFALAPGEAVHFTLREGATLIDEQWLVADELGLVHTAQVPLTKTRREARFERVAGTEAAHAGPSAPHAGHELAERLEGRAGDPAVVWFGLGDARGPSLPLTALTGISGAVVGLQLPAALPAGAWIWSRAWTGHGWAPWRSSVVGADEPGAGRAR